MYPGHPPGAYGQPPAGYPPMHPGYPQTGGYQQQPSQQQYGQQPQYAQAGQYGAPLAAPYGSQPPPNTTAYGSRPPSPQHQYHQQYPGQQPSELNQVPGHIPTRLSSHPAIIAVDGGSAPPPPDLCGQSSLPPTYQTQASLLVYSTKIAPVDPQTQATLQNTQPPPQSVSTPATGPVSTSLPEASDHSSSEPKSKTTTPTDPTQLRQQIQIPQQINPDTNSPHLIIPFTFHVAKYFIKTHAGRTFLGHFNINTQQYAKFVCRCVAKFNPRNPTAPYQPHDPANPQPLYIVFQDISGTWITQDHTVDQWCNVGDIMEMYAHIYPPQQQMMQAYGAPQQQQSVEPIIHPVCVKILSENDLKTKSIELNPSLDPLTAQLSAMNLNSIPDLTNSNPLSWFTIFNQHIQICRKWYAQNAYSKEYVRAVLKYKLLFLFDFENPYYILPITQQEFNSSSRITTDVSTRRVLLDGVLDITDRLVERVVHIPQITQCPQTPAQICTAHCAQLTIDDYTAMPNQIPVVNVPLPLGTGQNGERYVGYSGTKPPYNTVALLNTGIYPGQSLPLPTPPKSLSVLAASPQSQPFPGQIRPSDAVSQPFPGQVRPGEVSGYGYNNPHHHTTASPAQQLGPDGRPIVQKDPNQPQYQLVASAGYTHFDSLRNSYLSVPPMGGIIKIISQVSFSAVPTQQPPQQYPGQPSQNQPQSVSKVDVMYELLSAQYDPPKLQHHLTGANYNSRVLNILYEDLDFMKLNAAYGTYYHWHSKRDVETVRGPAVDGYRNDPTIFIVDQKVDKNWIDSHKDRFLDVTFDILDSTTPAGCNGIKPSQGDEWVMKSQVFRSRPLYQEGTILTTTGFIQCFEQTDFISSFVLNDGSTQPKEFIFGKNYHVLNQDIRFGSNRAYTPPPTAAAPTTAATASQQPGNPYGKPITSPTQSSQQPGLNYHTSARLPPQGRSSATPGTSTTTTGSTGFGGDKKDKKDKKDKGFKDKSGKLPKNDSKTTTSVAGTTTSSNNHLPGTTNQNATLPFTLHSGFRNGSVVKLVFEVKKDVVSPTDGTKSLSQPQSYHYNILAYQLLPCTSVHERDGYITMNVQRAKQPVECGSFIFFKDGLNDIKANITANIQTAATSGPRGQICTTPQGAEWETNFITHLMQDQSFLYDPTQSIPVVLSDLRHIKPPLGTLQCQFATSMMNDARSHQYFHTSNPLSAPRLLSSIVYLDQIKTEYDYKTSSKTNIVIGLSWAATSGNSGGFGLQFDRGDFELGGGGGGGDGNRTNKSTPNTTDPADGHLNPGQLTVTRNNPYLPSDFGQGSIAQIFWYQSLDQLRKVMVGYRIMYRFGDSAAGIDSSSTHPYPSHQSQFGTTGPTPLAYFKASEAIFEQSHAIYWDEMIMRRNLVSLCRDFAHNETNHETSGANWMRLDE